MRNELIPSQVIFRYRILISFKLNLKYPDSSHTYWLLKNFVSQMLGPVLKIWNMPQRREQHADRLRLALAHWTKLEKLIIWEPTKYPTANKLMWTDASLVGWGAHSENGDRIAGTWPTSLLDSHINVLEIQAVTELVQSELVDYNDSIKVHTDNITAFFAINNQGSSQSLEITKTVGFLRQWLK